MDSKRQRLGVSFRDLRKQRGLTQSDLARRAGRNQARVSEIETTHLDPQASTLLAMADALDAELMLIPREKIEQARRLLAPHKETSPTPTQDIFDEIFVPSIGKERDQ